MPLLSCQMFTLYLPPTIVVSYRGIEDSIRHHTTLWTGSSLGNYRLGAETSLLHFVSVIFGGDQKGVWSGGFGQRGGSFSGGVTAGRSAASLISPLNSALWRQSAGGIQKRSGICFFMDLLIMSRTRSTHWSYPRRWMVWSVWLFGWMPDYSREVSEHAELRRTIGWTTCLSPTATQTSVSPNQNPCRWADPVFPWGRSGGGVTRVFACIAELLGTSQHSVP